MADFTPQQFVEKWQEASINERQAAQHHFLDVCRLVGIEPPPPTGLTAEGKHFVFEQSLKKDTGRQGYADVWYEDHFAIEYKGQGKDLNAAYQQLLQYRENLKNPPLLVVCDIQSWEIHTNFPNTEKRVYRFSNQTLPQNLKVIRALFEDPDRLHPGRNTEQVTAEAAASFKDIVDEMRNEWQADPERIAHFMTKLVFCLFAEDVELLPQLQHHGIFSHIVEETRFDVTADRFMRYIQQLFEAMASGGDLFMKTIRYFNGSLFEDTAVEPLSQQARSKLADACRLNWSSVEPAIFGTLFERSLDPAKRAQLGAHYTSRDDILLIVEPVLMQPLRREWARILTEAAPIRERFDRADTPRARLNAQKELERLRESILHRLRTIRVLDPACGSGNFLYVSLGLLLNLEKEVINHPFWRGLSQPMPEVHPRQLYGIEINPIAHALASIVVWIGYIQWKQNNGYYQHHDPILEDLHDNIRLMDAILAFDADGSPTEPDWPEVDVIVGNPPFLGGNRIRQELGSYVDTLFSFYESRVPASADLVCYWFERARAQIEQGKARRAGLLATNSIRGGVNREVLSRIKQTGDIFMAWADRPWVLDGAAVRVSMVGFDKGDENELSLDGLSVTIINSDLTATVDITTAKPLKENANICFRTDEKGGAFDIPQSAALQMLQAKNQSGRSNSDVILRWVNGLDITRRPRNMWIIDFGTDTILEEAALYEEPFKHVEKYVKPVRATNNIERLRENWWIHRVPGADMRTALSKLSRYVVTPAVAKHRLFVWLDNSVLPDHQLYAFAREDDYFFGVLHSRLHEVWSLRMGTSLEDRPRYTPTTTFETFPFPWPPGQEPGELPPNPSPSGGEGSRESFAPPRPSWAEERGPGGEGKDESENRDVERWNIPPELHKKMTEIARQLRKMPTLSEDRLWQVLRGQQIEGRKFRRQQPIGPFVVDFYCASERLVVEVDGGIHESQRDADAWRQHLIESLGIRFVRVRAEDVEQNLPSVLEVIRTAVLLSTPPLWERGGEGSLPPTGGDWEVSVPPRPSWERGPGGEGNDFIHYHAIAAAARQLHEERHAWLNPPDVPESRLKDRTLTNLYNALNVFRGKEKIKITKDAGDFAPRLAVLHRQLDEAVCAAYGFDPAVLDDEEAILRELLALNLRRT